MRIQVNISALKESRWYELAVRFCLGGLITVAAGIIAKKYGPGVGGLFLAFPAIFPAGATLIEKHERERKEKLGLRGSVRGRKAASGRRSGSSDGKHRAAGLRAADLTPYYRLQAVDCDAGCDGGLDGEFCLPLAHPETRVARIQDPTSTKGKRKTPALLISAAQAALCSRIAVSSNNRKVRRA